jgi:hypothetical protein
MVLDILDLCLLLILSSNIQQCNHKWEDILECNNQCLDLVNHLCLDMDSLSLMANLVMVNNLCLDMGSLSLLPNLVMVSNLCLDMGSLNLMANLAMVSNQCPVMDNHNTANLCNNIDLQLTVMLSILCSGLK